MIDLANISLQFSGEYLFNNVNLRINFGDKIALVGPNGTGKSSLMKIMYGTLHPEAGKILQQKRTTIGYLPQEQVVHKGKNLLDEAKSALVDIVLLQKKEEDFIEALKNDLLSDEEKEDIAKQLGEVHHRLEELDIYTLESKVQKILTGLGFSEDDFEKNTETFSGGWQMRIALAKLLISQNDLLLLDEPTNHLDLDSLEWLIDFIKSSPSALCIVSHDKYFVNEVTNKTVEIYNHKVNVYNGKYDAYLKYKEERDLQAEAQFAMQQKKRKETQRFIDRFRYKNTKAKQVQSRIKQLEKLEVIELPEFQEEIYIRFPDPPQSGVVNIQLKDIHKAYDYNIIFEGLDFQINRGDKIAFVGPNGAGKTTLSKIITGKTEIQKGEKIIGHNTIISYYAQDVADSLDPELDILQTMQQVTEEKTIGQLRSLLGSFLFTGEDVFKKVGVLSGGEKSRVALAKILLTKANLIILDEPTNHLDLSSKKILQKALIDFKGSLVLVSHDIDFLTPIVNKVVEIRNKIVKEYPGDINYYLYKKQEQKINDAGEDLKKENKENVTRKEQKRLEAELRQKRYYATKEISQTIKKKEEEISSLEKKVKELEQLLANTEIYTNADKAKATTSEYNSVKIKLEQVISEWEKLSEELSEIERNMAVG